MADGPAGFTPDFSCPALLRVPARGRGASRTGLSPSAAALSSALRSRPFLLLAALQPRRGRNRGGLGSSPFARHYLGNHFCFLLLRVLRCFSSPRSPPRLARMAGLLPAGLPHSGTRGSKAICASPRLFAAYRALRRLREPRYPPSALLSFFSSCGARAPRSFLSRFPQHVKDLLRGPYVRHVENKGLEPLTPCVQGRCSKPTELIPPTSSPFGP